MLPLSLLMACGAAEVSMAEPAPPDTFCASAAALGPPGAEVVRCVKMLPDFYWVQLSLPEGAPARYVVVEGDRPVSARGYAAGGDYLRRVDLAAFAAGGAPVNAPWIGLALEALEALPPHFTANDSSDVADPDGHSRLALTPFSLTLIAADYDARAQGPPGGAAALDLDVQFGVGSAPVPAVRAALRQREDGMFTWRVEREAPGGWSLVEETAPF